MNISIVIVHFNQYELLKSLLEYLSESFNDILISFEILIIDNGSDGQAKVRSLVENMTLLRDNLLFYPLDENKGPSYARNHGVTRAKGAYIQFLDADDWIVPEKLTTQWAFAEKNGYPSLIVSPWARVTANSNPENFKLINDFDPEPCKYSALHLVSDNGFFQIGSCIIKKESYIKAGGMDPNIWLIEDVNFYLKLYDQFQDFNVAETKKPQFYQRMMTNGLAASNIRQFNRNALKNLDLAMRITKDKNEEFRKDIIGSVLYNVLLNAVKIKDKSLIVDTKSSIEKYCPDFNPFPSGSLKNRMIHILGMERSIRMYYVLSQLKKLI